MPMPTISPPDPSPSTPRLDRFVAQFSRLLDTQPVEAEVLARGGALLAALVAQDDWLPAAFAQPRPERYQQYALHVDARARFSVVSFVWGPGQATPIHDHTVWGLIGLLRGAEQSQAYARNAEGRWQPQSAPVLLAPGQVEAVSPRIGDVHRVSNALAGQPSISIHVYGADIGQVQRSVYLEDGTRKPFVSGYSQPAAPAPETQPSGAPVAPGFPISPSSSSLLSFISQNSMTQTLALKTFHDVRQALLAGQEIALIDVREEDPFAQAHPLFAANFPAGRLELDTWRRIPRLGTALVVYDNGEGLAEPAARTLQALGYTDVALLDGGLQGWRAAGGELFKDVNVPSKAFGELVESQRHTPSLAAEEVQALIDGRADVVVLDARRFEEYQTMSIPGGISVPGAELVLRARALAPNPATQIIVNCAGRTRSIIGTQSLVNAGLPNPVSALRNGTIGWTLAGQALDHGASRRFAQVSPAQRSEAAGQARAVADRAAVRRALPADLARFAGEAARTTYRYDVRTPEEFAAGHLPGFHSAPGGQLVQETDVSAPVRGARIVLADDDGARANMTASWLAQLGWEVWVLDGLQAADFSETGHPAAPVPEPEGPIAHTTPAELARWLQDGPAGQTAVLDLTTSANYAKRHIPGAWFVLRSELAQAVARIPKAGRYVLTCGSSLLARFAARDLQALTQVPVYVLEGGTARWIAAGLPLQSGETHLAVPRSDRYRRPYEGTDAPREAMQGYLDWEYGLVEQLGRDGTHGFHVI